jgi:hypothetical protein
MARFGLTKFVDREEFITDGPHDGGVDAFFIDQKNKTTFILQSKFRATSGNFKSVNMTADDLVKMDVKRIITGKKKDDGGKPYNEKILKQLQKAIQKLPDAGSYVTKVVLLGNAKLYSTGQMKKLVDGFAVDQYAHDRIYRELLFPVINGTYFADPNLKIEIKLENVRGDSHLDYDIKAHAIRSNIKLLFVPTSEMGRIMNMYKNSILKYNPRSFLELKNNAVNRDIETSLRDEGNNEFALFNNGITIISNETSISSNTAKKDTAQVVLLNPQLVNGGQTAYTLARIYEECAKKRNFSVFKGKEVLLRIITFPDSKKSTIGQRQKLIGDISKASNSQTRVDESDRRANDEIQVKMQEIFFERYGAYYERKRGEFSDGIRAGYVDSDTVVKRERLVRVALASDFKVSQARASIGQFFKHGALEQLLLLKDAEKYAYGYEVLRELERVRKVKPSVKGDRYHTNKYGQGLRYGQYAVLSICINRCLPKSLSEKDAVAKVLSQWPKFEAWAQKRSTNSTYKDDDGSFDFVNYYKGGTIGADLQNFAFAI